MPDCLEQMMLSATIMNGTPVCRLQHGATVVLPNVEGCVSMPIRNGMECLPTSIILAGRLIFQLLEQH